MVRPFFSFEEGILRMVYLDLTAISITFRFFFRAYSEHIPIICWLRNMVADITHKMQTTNLILFIAPLKQFSTWSSFPIICPSLIGSMSKLRRSEYSNRLMKMWHKQDNNCLSINRIKYLMIIIHQAYPSWEGFPNRFSVLISYSNLRRFGKELEPRSFFLLTVSRKLH